MVDATKSIGGIQNIAPSRSVERERVQTEQTEQRNSAQPTDEVSISREAAELAQADQDMRAIREGLERDQETTLSRAGDLEEFET